MYEGCILATAYDYMVVSVVWGILGSWVCSTINERLYKYIMSLQVYECTGVGVWVV